VVRTRVGYAGGTKKDPSYRDLGDHTETVQIDYDPSTISYQELLDAYWTGHDPTHRSWSRQYASIIFAHSEEQRLLAEESKTRVAKERRSTVHTEIVPYSGFTLAENYHQKHSLRQFPDFLEELQRAYPAPADFVASTAVARVNGFLGGEGSSRELLLEVDSLGLSPARNEELRELVRRHRGGETCPVPKE